MTKLDEAECEKVYEYLCERQTLNNRTVPWISSNLGLSVYKVRQILRHLMNSDFVVDEPVGPTSVYYAMVYGDG